jgi:SAM-dependent methyltransferase
MVRNRFFAAIPGSCPDAKLTNFAAQAQHLPLPNGSMNAVVLHHILECADDPRQVMREASRVLAPGGRLVLCGFNPWSLWGLGNLLRRARGMSSGNLGMGKRFIPHWRLLDWLAVLGFELNDPVRFAGYSIGNVGSGRFGQRGLAAQAWLNRLQPPIASSFIVSATKQAMSARPLLRDPTLARGKLAPVAYPKLNVWNRTESDK